MWWSQAYASSVAPTGAPFVAAQQATSGLGAGGVVGITLAVLAAAVCVSILIIAAVIIVSIRIKRDCKALADESSVMSKNDNELADVEMPAMVGNPSLITQAIGRRVSRGRSSFAELDENASSAAIVASDKALKKEREGVTPGVFDLFWSYETCRHRVLGSS